MKDETRYSDVYTQTSSESYDAKSFLLDSSGAGFDSGESLSEQALIVCMCDVYDTFNARESKELDRRLFVARRYILSSRKFLALKNFSCQTAENFLEVEIKVLV